jgi:hypothetical protein
MFKRIAILAVIALSLPFLLSPKQASAYSLEDVGALGENTFNMVPSCSNTYLDMWQWSTVAHNVESSWNANKDNNSYFMYRVDKTSLPDYTSPATPKNQYRIVFGNAANNMKFHYDASATHPEQITYTGTIHALTTVISEPSSVSDTYKTAWSSTGIQSGANEKGEQVVSGSTFSTGTFSIDKTAIYCAVGQHSIGYDPTWTYNNFSTSIPEGSLTGAEVCKPLDVACQFRKATSAISKGFAAIGMAIVQAITFLFNPDSDAIKTEYDTINTFFTNKLGFLTYPFTFIGSMFNAFTSSDAWCNSTSCSKNFGNFYGHAFTVNLGQMQATMPTVWTWFTAMLRGVTIFTLLLAVRNKYREVTSK